MSLHLRPWPGVPSAASRALETSRRSPCGQNLDKYVAAGFGLHSYHPQVATNTPSSCPTAAVTIYIFFFQELIRESRIGKCLAVVPGTTSWDHTMHMADQTLSTTFTAGMLWSRVDLASCGRPGVELLTRGEGMEEGLAVLPAAVPPEAGAVPPPRACCRSSSRRFLRGSSSLSMICAEDGDMGMHILVCTSNWNEHQHPSMQSRRFTPDTACFRQCSDAHLPHVRAMALACPNSTRARCLK